jgi:hypothetical protein
MKKYLLFPLLVFMGIGELWAQKISFVEVVSIGISKSEEEAISRALVKAISQVNGEAIASNTKLLSQAVEGTSIDGNGRKSSTLSQKSEFIREIEGKTKGVIRSWRIVGTEQTRLGETKVNIAAEVYVLQKSLQASRLKIALVPDSQASNEFLQDVLDALSINLVKSRKFAVIDKKHTGVIERQLNEIRNGQGGIESQVRLGADMAPDLLAVVSLGAFVESGKHFRVGVNLDVIDYATKQIKFSEQKNMKLNTDNLEVASGKRAVSVANALHRVLMYAVFPPMVVGTDGQHVTIAQGSDYFKVGDRLVLKKLGQELRDPHTKEFLSYDHLDVGEAVVTYTDARITRAKISKLAIPTLSAEAVLSERFQVARVGQSIDDLLGVTENSEKGKKKKSDDIFLIDDDD